MIRKERWKRMKDLDGIPLPDYWISNWGRILVINKGLKKRSLHKSRSNYYWRVNIKDKKYMVHILVAKYFIKGTGEQVNHKDLNTLNPSIDNLEYVTQSENIKHSHRNRFKSIKRRR